MACTISVDRHLGTWFLDPRCLALAVGYCVHRNKVLWAGNPELSKFLSSQPGVGQNMVFYASPAAMESSQFAQLHFFSNSLQESVALDVPRAISCMVPRTKIAYPARFHHSLMKVPVFGAYGLYSVVSGYFLLWFRPSGCPTWWLAYWLSNSISACLHFCQATSVSCLSQELITSRCHTSP